jgi:hypothetical protein
MNKSAIALHLKEAQEELNRTIHELETVEDYDFGELLVAMGHIYHHLNTAWNGRDASDEEHLACSDRDFEKWRAFPDSSEFLS